MDHDNPRIWAAEDAGKFLEMDTIPEKQLGAMLAKLRGALEAALAQMQATLAQRDEETRKRSVCLLTRSG